MTKRPDPLPISSPGVPVGPHETEIFFASIFFFTPLLSVSGFLIYLLISGCVSNKSSIRAQTVQECLREHVDKYGDLCMEGIDEDWDAFTAGEEAIKCVVESCL